MAAKTTKLKNHASYSCDAKVYEKIGNLMTNRPELVRQYLIKHASELLPEGAINFQTRQERLTRENYTAPYVTIHWAHMCQPIIVNGADNQVLKDIFEDVTGFGEDMEHVARERLWRFIRDGKVGTLVDSPDVIATNRAEARASGERSYQVVFDAVQIRDWSVFTTGTRKGQFSMVLLQLQGNYEKPRFTKYEQPPEEDAKFLWTTYETQSKSTTTAGDAFDAVVIEQGVGGISEIPFVVFGGGPEDSLIDDVYNLDLGIMNKTSVKDNIIYNQGFQRIVMTGVQNEEVTQVNEFSITLASNENAGVQVIPPGDATAAENEIAALKKSADRRGKFEFNQLSDDTRQVQSADSKAKDMRARVAIYDATLDYQQNVEERIIYFHGLFEGIDTSAASVSIGRDYGLEDEAEQVNLEEMVYNKGRELGVFELQQEITRSQTSRLKFLPTATETSEKVMERVMEAIETAEPPAKAPTFPQPNLTGGIFDTLDQTPPPPDNTTQQ